MTEGMQYFRSYLLRLHAIKRLYEQLVAFLYFKITRNQAQSTHHNWHMIRGKITWSTAQAHSKVPTQSIKLVHDVRRCRVIEGLSKHQSANSIKQSPLETTKCRYQSITQQYLKRCLIKDDSNYMFRPNVAIMFSSESMVVVLYRTVWVCHDGEISAPVMFAICYC